MSNETISIEIPAPPEGFEFDGIRYAQLNEPMFCDGEWTRWSGPASSMARYPVAVAVRKTEWVKPTDEDAKHRPKVQVWSRFCGEWKDPAYPLVSVYFSADLMRCVYVLANGSVYHYCRMDESERKEA